MIPGGGPTVQPCDMHTLQVEAKKCMALDAVLVVALHLLLQ